MWGQSQGHISFRCLIIKTAHEFRFTSSQLLPSKALNLLWLKKKKFSLSLMGVFASRAAGRIGVLVPPNLHL